MHRALRRYKRHLKIRKRAKRLDRAWGLCAREADWNWWDKEPGRLQARAEPVRVCKHRDRLCCTPEAVERDTKDYVHVLRKPNRERRSQQFGAHERRGGWPGTRLSAGSVPPKDRNDRIVVCRDGRYHVRDGVRVVLVTDSWRTAFKARNPDSDWCWLDELG